MVGYQISTIDQLQSNLLRKVLDIPFFDLQVVGLEDLVKDLVDLYRIKSSGLRHLLLILLF